MWFSSNPKTKLSSSSICPTMFRFNPRSADDTLFFQFFGLSSPFEDDIFAPFWNAAGGERGSSGMPRKAAAIERNLPCSLEDLYKGTTKKMKLWRDVMDASGRPSTMEEILTIEIKPGWKKGTKITFPEKGNEMRGYIPSDLVFIIDEKPHGVFKRDRNDLIVTQKISLVEALTGYTAQVTTLDGRNLTITISSIVSPNYEEVVKGEGMPIRKEPGKKGNLRIKFNVKFPTSVIHCKNARDMWLELQERFSHTNTVQLFNIENAIHSCEQGTSSVTTFFTRLKSLWDERDALCEIPPCSCDAVKEIKAYMENQKTMTFFMGLNDNYDAIRSNTVAIDPLPNVNKTYSMALCHEKQAEASNGKTVAQPEVAAFAVRKGSRDSDAGKFEIRCEKCNMTNHMTKNCRAHFKCTYCGGKGHSYDYCRRRKAAMAAMEGEQGSSKGNHVASMNERDALCEISPCSCDAAKEIKAYIENQKTMKFLMRLNDNYDANRSNTVAIDPLPNVNKAYSMALRHEKQAEASNGKTVAQPEVAAFAVRKGSHDSDAGKFEIRCEKCNMTNHRTKNCRAHFKCTYCGGKGHSYDYCRRRKAAMAAMEGEQGSSKGNHVASMNDEI